MSKQKEKFKTPKKSAQAKKNQHESRLGWSMIILSFILMILKRHKSRNSKN